jgi:hypothetical protein
VKLTSNPSVVNAGNFIVPLAVQNCLICFCVIIMLTLICQRVVCDKIGALRNDKTICLGPFELNAFDHVYRYFG